MNILFICGSLEPGRDGVGDYTRRLGGELIRKKCRVWILGLNDKFVDKEKKEIQQDGDIKIETLRLPALQPWQERIHLAANWATEFNPDWVSLQFVPFSFHQYGLPLKLGERLKKIAPQCRWHIMFHELWLGMHTEASIKLVLWGEFQKRIVKCLVQKLSFQVIHTQTKIYQIQLQKKIGLNPTLLPLFSNIPLRDHDCLINEEREHQEIMKDKISFVVFGGIHPAAPIREFTKEASAWGKNNRKEIELIFVGNCGPEQSHWVKSWESEGLVTKELGRQSPEFISGLLRSSHIGISTTSYALSEKSGSIAAMKEHGLPVVCVSHFWQARGVDMSFKIPGVYEYIPGNLNAYLSQRKNSNQSNSESNLSNIAEQFLKSLKVE